MKHSHLTTPRTTAECKFTTDYTRSGYKKPTRLGNFVYGAVCLACFAGIGVILAWRG